MRKLKLLIKNKEGFVHRPRHTLTHTMLHAFYIPTVCLYALRLRLRPQANTRAHTHNSSNLIRKYFSLFLFIYLISFIQFQLHNNFHEMWAQSRIAHGAAVLPTACIYALEPVASSSRVLINATTQSRAEQSGVAWEIKWVATMAFAVAPLRLIKWGRNTQFIVYSVRLRFEWSFACLF